MKSITCSPSWFWSKLKLIFLSLTFSLQHAICRIDGKTFTIWQRCHSNWFDFWRTIYIQNKLACDIFLIISEANHTFNEWECVVYYVLSENCHRNLIFNKFKINFVLVLSGLKNSWNKIWNSTSDQVNN